jgi:phage shock protein C
METRYLRRSRSERLLGGVLGGIAQYYGWDAVLLRVVYVVVTIFTGLWPGLLIYLALWIVIPEEGDARPLP